MKFFNFIVALVLLVGCTREFPVVRGDAGTRPTIMLSDSGLVDGGSLLGEDSGLPGVDSGVVLDAGVDSGSDAGPLQRYSLRFDGRNDMVELDPANLGDLGQSFTIEAWVKPETDIYSNPVGGFIVQRAASGEDITLYFSRDNNGAFGFQVNGMLINAPAPSSLNVWHHIAGVFNEGSISLYVDGNHVAHQDTTEHVDWFPAREVGFVIGREGHPDARGSFVGEIDEIRVTNDARYFRPSHVMETHLDNDVDSVAVFFLDEGFGDICNDASGRLFGVLHGPRWILSDRM